MGRIILLILILQSIDTLYAKKCRCGDSNGACELEPKITQKNLFNKIVINKTEQQAYSLIEKTSFKKNGVKFELEQGGCDHMYTSYIFEYTDQKSTKNIKHHLRKFAEYLKTANIKYTQDILEAIQKGSIRYWDLRVKKPKGDVLILSKNPYTCDDYQTGGKKIKDAITCMFVVTPNYSYFEYDLIPLNNNRFKANLVLIRAL
jgi:hypothetical protein